MLINRKNVGAAVIVAGLLICMLGTVCLSAGTPIYAALSPTSLMPQEQTYDLTISNPTMFPLGIEVVPGCACTSVSQLKRTLRPMSAERCVVSVHPIAGRPKPVLLLLKVIGNGTIYHSSRLLHIPSV